MKQAKLFCHFCGAPLGSRESEGRERLYCEAERRFIYENPIPAATGIVTDDANRILLVNRNREPGKNQWALPGGFIEMHERPGRRGEARARGGVRNRRARPLPRRHHLPGERILRLFAPHHRILVRGIRGNAARRGRRREGALLRLRPAAKAGVRGPRTINREVSGETGRASQALERRSLEKATKDRSISMATDPGSVVAPPVQIRNRSTLSSGAGAISKIFSSSPFLTATFTDGELFASQ